MSSKHLHDLRALERVAKLRSDIEMKKFSVFRGRVNTARAKIAQMEDSLQDLYEVPAAFSVAEARLTNALTIDRVHAIAREEAHLARLLPAFEMARQAAVKEFGRVEVLRKLHDNLSAELDLKKRRKE